MDIATLTQILEIAFTKKVSDIHFEVNNPPIFRARGHLIRSKLSTLTKTDTEFIASTVMAQSNRKIPEDRISVIPLRSCGITCEELSRCARYGD